MIALLCLGTVWFGIPNAYYMSSSYDDFFFFFWIIGYLGLVIEPSFDIWPSLSLRDPIRRNGDMTPLWWKSMRCVQFRTKAKPRRRTQNGAAGAYFPGQLRERASTLPRKRQATNRLIFAMDRVTLWFRVCSLRENQTSTFLRDIFGSLLARSSLARASCRFSAASR